MATKKQAKTYMEGKTKEIAGGTKPKTNLAHIDFLQDAFGSSASKLSTVPAAKPSLDALLGEGRKMVALAAEIENLNSQLNAKKEAYALLEREIIPEMMASLEMKDFSLTNGNAIVIEPFVSANIPSATAIEKAQDEERAELEARRDEAFKWLRSHKYDSLIKNTVTCSLAKGQERMAALLMKFAKENKLSAVRQSTVHPSTLASFVKEQLKKGADIPFDTFNIQTGNRAILKESKER